MASLLGVSADTNGVYFLFTAQAEIIRESFVLKLTQPADIEYARERIRSGVTDYSAALVNIAEGPDRINRDHLTPGAPQWSWHITGFLGFSEVVPANQTANPSEIEADVPGWIAMLQGRAAFFYDPVLELLPPPSIMLSLT